MKRGFMKIQNTRVGPIEYLILEMMSKVTRPLSWPEIHRYILGDRPNRSEYVSLNRSLNHLMRKRMVKRYQDVIDGKIVVIYRLENFGMRVAEEARALDSEQAIFTIQ